MRQHAILLIVIVQLLLPITSNANMSGANGYQIYSDNFNVTSGGQATGDGYTLTGTVGSGTATTTVGDSYIVRGGFEAETSGILIYEVSKSAVSLGTGSTASVSSDSLTLTVSTDSTTGYTVSITQDGKLRTATGIAVADVSGGGVIAGTEGYGIRTSGGSGVLSGDTAIANGLTIASTSTVVTSDQTTVQFRAAIGAGSRGGSYSHSVNFLITVNP